VLAGLGKSSATVVIPPKPKVPVARDELNTNVARRRARITAHIDDPTFAMSRTAPPKR